ncbi:uncharacterized protein LOC136064997 [Quercus suber]|uniref:uncharacterized protein LOC136064997 n=1 Tax=Quercus suber TaxID=58331 RepID=UPI0032DEF890
MEAKNPSSASYAWKSIIKGRAVIQRGAVWRIRDGRSVSIWGDHWLSVRHSPKIVSLCTGALTDAKVSSLIDSDRRSWKEENSQPGQSDPDYLKPLWKAIWSLQVLNNRNPDLFSMVTWAIWNRRNNLHLGKVAASLDELLSQSLDRIQDFKLNNSSLATTVGHPPTRWQAPDQDNYKVNFNGALFSEANTAGIGVVIRNEEGQVMVSLSQKTTLPFTAIEVEAMAARRALELALETGFQQIILEGDSQILLSALEKNFHTLSNFGHLITDIQYLASCFSKMQYSHVRKHCNTVAHSLARRAVSLSQMQVWMEDVPPDITHVLQADLNGLL